MRNHITNKFVVLLILLWSLGCSDHVYTHFSGTGFGGEGGQVADSPNLAGAPGLGGAQMVEMASGGAASGAGGAQVVEMASGGDASSGGAPDGAGGAQVVEVASGGAASGAGGAPALEPPYLPSCSAFACGSYTPEGAANEVLCLDVKPNASNAGNFGGVGCTATLDGQRFYDFSRGVPAGRLVIWGCDFWFNCYEDR